ncbi:unannotated protein [freshwater metagenome]|uniref:Unannotated protein n=1 Tax=freshwater metagenome TaxID=449393 RepID=A0A6J6V596_9ZZZZ
MHLIAHQGLPSAHTTHCLTTWWLSTRLQCFLAPTCISCSRRLHQQPSCCLWATRINWQAWSPVLCWPTLPQAQTTHSRYLRRASRFCKRSTVSPPTRALPRLPPQSAMATHRRRSMYWKRTTPICVGSIQRIWINCRCLLTRCMSTRLGCARAQQMLTLHKY